MNIYRIASLYVKLNTFGRTERQAAPYLIDGNRYDISVESDIMKAKSIYPDLSDDDCEYMATAVDFYRQLLNFDGFQLHSSAVVVDGKAYLFTANSGTGKSTHTGLWLKQFGERAFILNDDKPALRLEDGVWYAYGTPWSGKHDISVNARVPVAGIACLERGEINKIEPFSGRDAVLALLRQCNRPKAAEYRIKLLELLDKLITQVPVWKLKCNMDPEAAIVSYEAMSGCKFEEN
jgi:hypothetical protein